jgi:hypothetical protein
MPTPALFQLGFSGLRICQSRDEMTGLCLLERESCRCYRSGIDGDGKEGAVSFSLLKFRHIFRETSPYLLG